MHRLWPPRAGPLAVLVPLHPLQLLGHDASRQRGDIRRVRYGQGAGVTDHSQRLARNRDSLKDASNHLERWSEDEVTFLFEMWKAEPLEDIAAVLGRTIEACREKYHKTAREGLTIASPRNASRPYRGWMMTDGDGWD